jgi:hypothetical protein
MSEFCPEGYVATPRAIVEAALYWFKDQMALAAAALETAPPATQETGTDGLAALARAISLARTPQVTPEVTEVLVQSARRLRNLLLDGKELTAYYYGGLFDLGCRPVESEFWATPEADGVLESGQYFPFGRPTAWHTPRPSSPLFLRRAELDKLLSEPVTAKKPLPRAKEEDLAAALRQFDHLPRDAQRAAVRDLPEFQPYHITEANWRAAAKAQPRSPGRRQKP